jgi:hypothetical protein
LLSLNPIGIHRNTIPQTSRLHRQTPLASMAMASPPWCLPQVRSGRWLEKCCSKLQSRGPRLRLACARRAPFNLLINSTDRRCFVVCGSGDRTTLCQCIISRCDKCCCKL